MQLEGEFTPGQSLIEVLKLDDHRLDIEVESNRGDLLSHMGIARARERIVATLMNDRGTAHDLHRPFAGLNLTERQSIRIGVLHHGFDTRNHDVLEASTQGNLILHGRAPQREAIHDFVHAQSRSGHEITKPSVRSIHDPTPRANWPKNRMSFSKNSLRSGTPYFSRAIRAGPIPNANPE